jgi:hypothetical protein
MAGLRETFLRRRLRDYERGWKDCRRKGGRFAIEDEEMNGNFIVRPFSAVFVTNTSLL